MGKYKGALRREYTQESKPSKEEFGEVRKNWVVFGDTLAKDVSRAVYSFHNGNRPAGQPHIAIDADAINAMLYDLNIPDDKWNAAFKDVKITQRIIDFWDEQEALMSDDPKNAAETEFWMESALRHMARFKDEMTRAAGCFLASSSYAVGDVLFTRALLTFVNAKDDFMKAWLSSRCDRIDHDTPAVHAIVD